MQYYVIHPSGQKYGPADLATLNEWIVQQRVQPDYEVEEFETGRRFRASQLPGLQFGQQSDWSRAPGQSYGQGAPYPTAQAKNWQQYVTLSWVFGSLGLFCCIAFGVLGIVFGYLANKNGIPSGKHAMIFSIVTTCLNLASTIYFQVANPFQGWLR